MNWFLLAAAALALLTTGVHIFLGGKTCLAPMLAADFDPVAKRTLYVCWHCITLDLSVSTVVLWMAGLEAHSGWAMAAAVVSTLNLGYALIFTAFAATASFPKPWTQLPQGFALGPIGGLGLWGVFGGAI